MTMRNTTGLLLVLLLVFSCQEDAQITSPIEGKWKGTLAEIQVKPFGLPIPITKDDASFNTQIEFRSEGTLIILEGSQPSEGTYQLAGDELTIDTDYKLEDVNLSGTYTIETLTESSLVFHLKKKRQTIVDPDGGPTVKGQVKVTLHFRRM